MKIWSFKGIKSKITIKNESKVLVFSTLSHLQIDFKQNIKIISKIWGELPKLLKSHNLTVKWLYDFTKGIHTETPKKAFKLLNNNPNNSYQAHSLLVPLRKLKTLIRSLKLYVKYYIFFQGKFKFLNSKINSSNNALITCYFKTFKFSFYDSFFGICAIENILYSLTFDDILGSLNKQNLGLYINENQGWEFLFVKSWKKYNHGKLVSIQHSSVRFWDLRYYYREWINDNLTPSFISVNGNAAKKSFLKSNYPHEKIIQLESLRYNYLTKFDKSLKISKSKNILILGDILFLNTFKIIQVVEKIVKYDKYNFTFKSHPACTINPQLLKNFNTTNQNLSELLNNFDTVICCASSGGILEPFILGLKVILFVEDKINTSPLYGYVNSMYFSTSAELLSCFERLNDVVNTQDFFYLNSDYKNWNQLLKNI